MGKFFKFLTNKYTLYTIGAIVSVVLITVVFFQSKDAFIKIWSEVKVKYLFLCLACSALIYICMGLSLWEVLRAMGKKIHIAGAIGIALVSTTVNYLVSSFGVSGFALRAHMLGRRRVPFGMSVTASIVLTVIIYIVLAMIILQGSLLMFFTTSATTVQVVQNLMLIIAMVIICAIIITFFFNNDLRISWVRKTFRLVNRVSYKLFTLLIPKARFDNFTIQLERGINFIQKKKGRLTLAVIYVCADWLFTILILYFAFRAVGIKIAAGVLVAGFAVGMVTTLIPILPGGLGAMELAMTAMYANAGIPWESALTACIIYRFMYYIVPGLASIIVYWTMQVSDSYNKRKRARIKLQRQAKVAKMRQGGFCERKD